MHVLLIHQAFTAGSEAGGTRHYELARHLKEKGHQITVITSMVSYLTGGVIASAGRFWVVRENLDGIEVRRTWTYTALHRSFVTRVLSFLSFMISSLAVALLIRKVDVVWGTSPPIFQAVTAFVISRLKRVPLALEVRDLWPDFAVEIGVLRSQPLIWASRYLERFLYRHADRIIVNSPGFISHLIYCGANREKIDIVANGVDAGMFNPYDQGEVIRGELGLEGKFVALYAGAHGLANDLGIMLRAAQYLIPYADIVFVLVGDGKERSNLIRQAEELRLTNVLFVPAQPKNRMPQFMAAADVCIAILKPIPMFTTTYPNKVFDYMAAGRPTVLAIDGVIREVVEAASAGIFVAPGDAWALAEAIRKYFTDPKVRKLHGKRARTYVLAHFDRLQQAACLQEIFGVMVHAAASSQAACIAATRRNAGPTDRARER